MGKSSEREKEWRFEMLGLNEKGKTMIKKTEKWKDYSNKAK